MTNYIIGLCFTAIFTALAANGAHTSQAHEHIKSPFRVVWNIPDMACRVDFELSKYGIVANNPRHFVGNEIATLYSTRIGLWPHFDNQTYEDPMNGGIPQLANLTAHLEKLRQDIAILIPEHSTGYGVFDQELWRVIFDLNYSSFNVYRWASVEEVKRRDPHADARDTARKEFEQSAKEIMERSLLEAQAVRPHVHWGYYLYPQIWRTNGTELFNDRMAWLYNASTGIYPSIYLNNAKTYTRADMERGIQATLNEAIRVRSLHGRPETPIMAYTLVQNDEFFFPKDILDLAIGQPAEMGIDGVVIWGSSSLFKPRPSVKCDAIKKYVHDILGPYVSQLLSRLTHCSTTKCSGRGRCVRKDNVERVSQILAKRSFKRSTHADSSQTTSSDLPKRDNYYQHYKNTYGSSWLRTTKEPSLTKDSYQRHDSDLSSTSSPDSSPQNSETLSLFDLISLYPVPATTSATTHGVYNSPSTTPCSADPDCVRHHADQVLEEQKANWRENHVTAQHSQFVKDEYENYVCQCYEDWQGPSCNSRN